jgi:hypothetical protein
VIVRDEEQRLPRCLSSLGWCDEVVVVDSGSRDGTVEVAHRAGARVIENPWPGFGAQRNVAMDHAHGDWVIEVDADEWLSEELAAEIEAFVADDPREYSSALMPMRQHFLGGELGPSAHYPFYRLRMFRRGEYRHNENRAVHEGLSAHTRPWVFTGDMHHELAGSWREALVDAWAYARLEARQLDHAPAKVVLAGLTARPLAKLFYQLLLLGGWRDGWRGALKVALECAADVVVWVRYLARDGPGPGRPESGRADGPPAGHFGRRRPRVGPIRLAAVGGRRTLAREPVRGWLADAQGAGAWVTVIAPQPPSPSAGLRYHAISRRAPASLMRALDSERQLGALDGVVGLDRWSRLVLRLLPGAVRSHAGVSYVAEPASELVGRLRIQTRGEGPAA